MQAVWLPRRASTSIALAMALLFTSAAHAQPAPSVPVSGDEVVHGDTTLPNLALVFNVGAGYEPATAILEALADRQQHATFFVMGWWAERHPDELRQIAAAGHEIASHGHSIFDLTQASDAQVRADLLDADRAISSVTGRSTRPLWSPSAGYRDARVRAIAADLGYRPILWTVDSGDWTTDASPESVYSHIVNGAANGAIIVLHYDSPHSALATAEVLPAAIDSLRGAGFHLMTITELLTSST
ncbi:MAG TPA: polysaccharide deacetylase family protein [Chloroflexota bacterium]|jgi:peptidoglycan/xylan/chitin deacetylase (PgdA/CDA1 family)